MTAIILKEYIAQTIVPMGLAAVALLIFHGILGLISYYKDLWYCSNLVLWSHWATQSINIVYGFPATVLYITKYIVAKTDTLSVLQVWGVILATMALVAISTVVLYLLHKEVYNREIAMN